MHPMPLPSPAAKPRRRLTLRRVLLALMLGVMAWWGVGWWLAVRPDIVLRYAGGEVRVVPALDGPGPMILLLSSADSNQVTLEYRDPDTGRLQSARTLPAGQY